MTETGYIKDCYGKCKLEKCKCLREGWRGWLCPYWEPVKENTFEEMIERLKNERKRSKVAS